MTREETKLILASIKAIYPNFDYGDAKTAVDAWFFCLSEYGYDEINMALKMFVTSANSAFAPSASQLIAMTRKIAQLTLPDVTKVWDEVRGAIRNSLYHHEEEFEKLSPLAKKTVGYAGQLRDWAQCETQEIETVIYSNFKDRFKTMQAKEAEIQAMPKEVRQVIEERMTMMIEDKKGD